MLCTNYYLDNIKQRNLVNLIMWAVKRIYKIYLNK